MNVDACCSYKSRKETKDFEKAKELLKESKRLVAKQRGGGSGLDSMLSTWKLKAVEKQLVAAQLEQENARTEIEI